VFNRSLKRLAGAALAVCALGFASSAFAADTIESFYKIRRIGVAASYGTMGFTDADGNFVSLVGQQIVSTRVVIDFTPAPGVDWTTLVATLQLPVEGAQSQLFQVFGSDLVETTPGTYHFELTSKLNNGTIFDSRWGIETYGLTADGGAMALPGTLGATTGYYVTATLPSSPVPEPATAWLLLAGLGLVPALARRARQG